MLTIQVLGGNVVDRPATQRDRLAAVDGELVVLQAQYELAMSGFKFDEASALQRKIAVLESERRALAASGACPGPAGGCRADAASVGAGAPLPAASLA